MEELRDTVRRPIEAKPPAPLPAAPATDVARLAGEAAARADAAPLAPSVVRVTVKTSGNQAAEIAATPDTPIAEIMVQACRELGVRDPGRYVLVAQGEVIGDPSCTIGDVVGEGLGSDLTTRLVKRPEAGS